MSGSGGIEDGVSPPCYAFLVKNAAESRTRGFGKLASRYLNRFRPSTSEMGASRSTKGAGEGRSDAEKKQVRRDEKRLYFACCYLRVVCVSLVRVWRCRTLREWAYARQKLRGKSKR